MPAANFLKYAEVRQNALNLIKGEYEDKLKKLKEANPKNAEIQKKTAISITDLSAQAQLQIEELSRAIINLDKSSKADEEKSIILTGLMDDIYKRVDRSYNTGVWWVLGKMTSRVDAKNSYFYNNLRPAMGEIITPKAATVEAAPKPTPEKQVEGQEVLQEIKDDEFKVEDTVFSENDRRRMAILYHMYNAENQLSNIHDETKFQKYVKENVHDDKIAKILLESQKDYIARHKVMQSQVNKNINELQRKQSNLKGKYPEEQVDLNHSASAHLKHAKTEVKHGQVNEKMIQPKDFKDIKSIQDRQRIFAQSVLPKVRSFERDKEERNIMSIKM